MYAFYESRIQKFSTLKSLTIRSYPAHWHSDIEIIKILDGKLDMVIGGKTYPLCEGDLCFVGSGEIHSYNSVGVTTPSNIYFIGRELLGEYWKLFYGIHTTNPHIKSGSPLGTILTSLLERTNYEPSNEDKLFLEFKEEALVYGICLAVLEGLEWEHYSVREYVERERKVERLHKILDYIDTNYINDISLDDISNEMGFSSYYFSRFFKKATGINFIQYLTAIRIRRAMRLLLTTDYLVSEIVYMVGFGSIKTFNRVFKEINGMSPLEYKKSKK